MKKTPAQPHRRKTKQERYEYNRYSYWGVSLMYWTTSPFVDKVPTSIAVTFVPAFGPKHTNLYLRIGDGYFDYNLLRSEIKRLLHTSNFVLLNRWKAMPNEYRSFVQYYERTTAPVAGIDAATETSTEAR